MNNYRMIWAILTRDYYVFTFTWCVNFYITKKNKKNRKKNRGSVEDGVEGKLIVCSCYLDQHSYSERLDLWACPLTLWFMRRTWKITIACSRCALHRRVSHNRWLSCDSWGFSLCNCLCHQNFRAPGATEASSGLVTLPSFMRKEVTFGQYFTFLYKCLYN